MGEAKRRLSATAKLVADNPLCAVCGVRPSATRDHIPPTAMFDGGHRPNELVLPACQKCNALGRTADLVASIVARWAYNLDEIEARDHARLAARLRTQALAIVKEMTSMAPEEKKEARQTLIDAGVHVPNPAGLVAIGPLTIKQLNLFAHRVAAAIYFAKLGTGVGADGLVWASWRTKEDLQIAGLPQEFLQMLPKTDFLKQGEWSTQDTFEYRYQINDVDQLLGVVARFRRALFVIGLCVGPKNREHFANDKDWISPATLDRIVIDQNYEKRS